MAKILLVEDEDFIRQLYKRQFEKAGYVIEDFANGKDGVAAGLKNQYDLILLDIMLPDVNGIDILKQIKENQTVGKTPVVMLTNLGQDDVIKEGFKFGATGYLIKAAYTPDQVVQEVTNILAQQSALLTNANASNLATQQPGAPVAPATTTQQAPTTTPSPVPQSAPVQQPLEPQSQQQPAVSPQGQEPTPVQS